MTVNGSESLYNEKFLYSTREASSIPNFSGIYCIRDVTNDKKYVGQASHLKNRISTHISLLKKGRHHCKNMQKDWRIHGEEAFEFYVVCRCKRDMLNIEEQTWIKKLNAEYNTIKNTLNFSKKELKEEDISYIPGLEEKYLPLKWHRWVYGAGRH